MLRYQKGAEPQQLRTVRSTPGASYGSLGRTDRDAIREALVRDQGGLCAYCQQRIRPDSDSMEIEHWLSRAQHPNQQLIWRNMLGVCKGGSRVGDREERHCDEIRGSAPLFLDPLEGSGPNPRIHLKYDGRGGVRSDDARANNDILFAEVQRPRAIWAQMRFVGRWAESNKWHDVATCPVLVDKLKALADEIERQQTAATEKAK